MMTSRVGLLAGVALRLGFVTCAAAQAGMTSRTIPQATADKHGAKCLNGAPPSVEIRLNASSTKWVLFLEGGGWCFGSTPDATLASCAGRARGGGGSSAHNPPTAPDYGGVMSANSTLNPRFHSWNQVFMKYCDGSSFGGLNAAPVPHSAKPVHFRGRACFDALVQDLQKSYGLSKATEVILSGGSAGGLAVFYNLDHLAELLGSKVMLTGFPDAGVSPPSSPNSAAVSSA